MATMAKFVKASDPAALQFSCAAPFTCSLLTVEEVAELLKVPVSWVYEHTRKRGLDRIPGFRLGKYWRFDAAEVRTWLERQRTGGRANA